MQCLRAPFSNFPLPVESLFLKACKKVETPFANDNFERMRFSICVYKLFTRGLNINSLVMILILIKV